MRRADRLFQIIQVLRRTRKPLTADAIAAELETSKRTIYRDIGVGIYIGAPMSVPSGEDAGATYTTDFGERTHYDPKSAKALPNFPDMHKKLKPGDTMRAPGFLQLNPR